jgi:ribulose 1,5-bisphosphate synthetase/thiazole synthase
LHGRGIRQGDTGSAAVAHDLDLKQRSIMTEITRDVVIVGAGAAGLTAANELKKAGARSP